MRVLVTGGAGYIGYSLVNLLDQNENISEITVFDNLLRNNTHFFTEGNKLKKTKFLKGDILNLYELENAVKDKDIVVHLAAHVEFPYSYQDNYKYEQVNHYGTVVLYNLLERFPVEKVIFLSSAAVYGFSEKVTESTPPAPINFYGSSKLQAEKYLQLLENHSNIYLLRSGNVFGYNPMLRLDSVINRFIFDTLVYEKIKIHGVGNQLRPFISLATLTQEILNFIMQDRVSGIYNLVEFNQSMNRIRDYLMTKNPDLEFAYLNSNQEFKTVSMFSEKLDITRDFEETIEPVYQQFEESIRLK